MANVKLLKIDSLNSVYCRKVGCNVDVVSCCNSCTSLQGVVRNRKQVDVKIRCAFKGLRDLIGTNQPKVYRKYQNNYRERKD